MASNVASNGQPASRINIIGKIADEGRWHEAVGTRCYQTWEPSIHKLTNEADFKKIERRACVANPAAQAALNAARAGNVVAAPNAPPVVSLKEKNTYIEVGGIRRNSLYKATEIELICPIELRVKIHWGPMWRRGVKRSSAARLGSSKSKAKAKKTATTSAPVPTNRMATPPVAVSSGSSTPSSHHSSYSPIRSSNPPLTTASAAPLVSLSNAPPTAPIFSPATARPTRTRSLSPTLSEFLSDASPTRRRSVSCAHLSSFIVPSASSTTQSTGAGSSQTSAATSSAPNNQFSSLDDITAMTDFIKKMDLGFNIVVRNAKGLGQTSASTSSAPKYPFETDSDAIPSLEEHVERMKKEMKILLARESFSPSLSASTASSTSQSTSAGSSQTSTSTSSAPKDPFAGMMNALKRFTGEMQEMMDDFNQFVEKTEEMFSELQKFKDNTRRLLSE